jgi:hypothetical protein
MLCVTMMIVKRCFQFKDEVLDLGSSRSDRAPLAGSSIRIIVRLHRDRPRDAEPLLLPAREA